MSIQPTHTPGDFTLQERFQYDLSELYDVEKNEGEFLPRIAQECTDPEVTDLLHKLTQESQNHMQALSRCFQATGTQPQQVTGTTVMGLQQEYALLGSTKASQNEKNLYCLHAAAKIAAYEVAAYRALADMARLMGNTQCQQALDQTLQEEESSTQTIQQIRGRMGQQSHAGVSR